MVDRDITITKTVLRQADTTQQQQTWRATYETWGKTCGLSLEQYLRQEEALSKTPHTIDGLVCWVLVPDDDPETLDLLSHCETLRRPALVSLGSTENADPDKVVQDTQVMSVASVFTPERYRRRGYAGRMLKLLKEEMQRKPGVSFSTLFSDVGRTCYARLGWSFYPSREFSLKVSQDFRDLLEDDSALRYGGAIEPQLLALADVSLVAEQDCSLIRSEMIVGSVEPGVAARTAVTVLPTAELYDWIFTAMRCHGVADGVPVGVRFVSGGGDAIPAFASFAMWYIDLHAKKMTILRFRHSSPEDIAIVLRAAVDVASRLGLDTVVGWCPTENTDLELFCSRLVSRAPSFAKVADRDRWLPGLAAWGPAAAVDASGSQGPQWLHCERYGWI